ncbi:MAG TPA: TatD family hydrolase, partial [Nitrosopumilaceae archaeon]|nr:TatD family hydrolase [Nitrosopumilaceae archaeon]
MTLTDTHTHLYAEEFNSDRNIVIENARKLGIQRFYLPNVDSSTIPGMLALEKEYPDHCFAMMGLHPCSVKSNYKEELLIVEKWLAERKFSAIGEIGIDLYWDKTFIEEQRLAFSRQIDLALKYALPIAIHCRNAFDEIYE